MLSKKITCGVCGYRITPKKEEIYVAEEPRVCGRADKTTYTV